MQILISGVDKTSLLKRQTIFITDNLNARTTCSFTLVDKTGAYHPDVGEEVLIYDNEELIFGGTIDEPEENNPPGTDALDIPVQAVDWHEKADRLILAEEYNEEYAGDIVKDLISKKLALEGITEGVIQDGPIISKAVFPYIPVSQCLDELCEITGYQWVIRPDKSLDFFERSTNAAPWSIDVNSPIMNIKVRRNRVQFRNRQYLRAGKDISTVQTREFVGDGKTQVWAVDLPIAKVPTVKVNGATKTVGIRGVETEKDFYWQRDDKTISQDYSGTPLEKDVDILTIEYQGFYPIIVLAEDGVAIEERKAVEGGTGIYEHVEERRQIDTQAAALESAQGLLRRYARISKVVTFNTYEPGLKPGQLIPVNLPIHNVSESLLISQIATTDPGRADGKLLYSVECLSGEAVGGWVQFFKKLVDQGKTFVIRENEILISLITFRVDFPVPEMEDEMTYTLHQYHICGQIICGTDVII